MIIRQEQVLAFQRNAVQGFVLRMEERLRTLFPQHFAGIGSSEIQSKFLDSIEMARKFGLTRECDVEGYLIVLCASSVDTPTDWMLQILGSPAIPAEHKIGVLYRDYKDRQRRR